MEDIGFLKNKSKKDSYLFFIDSADRNLDRHPNPNEYTIRFNTPFKNVYSLEVIDASIPRTQYTVDTHSNKLKYTHGGIDYDLEIPVGDYSDQLLINKLNELFESRITIENLSTPASVNNTFLFKSTETFSFDMTQSTTSEVLGFLSNQVYTSQENSAYFERQTMLSDFSDDSYSFTIDNTNVLYQSFQTSEEGYLSSFQMNASTTSNTITVKACLYKYVSDGSFSKKSKTVVQTVSSTDTTVVTFDFVNGPFDDTTDEYSLLLENNSIYYIKVYYLSTDDSKVTFSAHLTNLSYEQLFFDANSLSMTMLVPSVMMSETDIDDPIYINTFSTNSPDDVRISLDGQVYVNVTTQTIIAPGLYSLIGDRYIILRCPEIEDHMFHSRAFEKYNMGLAKFKLAVMGYGEERFDYTGLPPRSFHPIGKLDQLSFRFERPTGSLYNFRGINHTITFLIKYLTPYVEPHMDYSRLNPEYNPDYLEYIQETKSDRSDSSEEDPDDYEFERSKKFQYVV